jgi:hypothetical protein
VTHPDGFTPVPLIVYQVGCASLFCSASDTNEQGVQITTVLSETASRYWSRDGDRLV